MRRRDRRRFARLFVVGLGSARLLEGAGATAAPGMFLRLLGAGHPLAGERVGIRMKSGRDVALGLLTLAAVGDDRRLAEMAATAVVVDAVDALAVVQDGRDAFGTPVFPLGAVVGVAVAGGAVWAARTLTDR